MADVKISELTELSSANVAVDVDVLAIVDNSASATKKIAVENLLAPIVINKATNVITNLGAVTTCDINGGTIDGAAIGGATPAAGTFTTMTANTSLLSSGTLTVGSATTDQYIDLKKGDSDKHGIMRFWRESILEWGVGISSGESGDDYQIGGGRDFAIWQGPSGSQAYSLKIDTSKNATFAAKVQIGASSSDSMVRIRQDSTQAAPNNAATALTLSGYSSATQFGGGIGWTWNDAGSSIEPACWFGTVAESYSGHTQAALVLATRNTTNNTAPTERMRIAGDGNVGIGHTTPQYALTLAQTDRLGWEDAGNNKRASIFANGANDDLEFCTGTSDALAMSIGASQNVAIGVDPQSDYKLFVQQESQGNWAAKFFHDGNTDARYGCIFQNGQDTADTTNYAIRIQDGDGGLMGDITFNGSTVSYGTFTAHHEASLPTADADSEYPYGTLVEIVSIYYKQKNGADSERGIRYNVKKTSSKYSKKVLGTYAGSMNNNPQGETNLHQVDILGDGHILCNGEKGNIEVGDGICSSSTDGEGMKTDKMAMIIGIAQEDVSFSGSESKLVAVQYGLQQFEPWS